MIKSAEQAWENWKGTFIIGEMDKQIIDLLKMAFISGWHESRIARIQEELEEKRRDK